MSKSSEAAQSENGLIGELAAAIAEVMAYHCPTEYLMEVFPEQWKGGDVHQEGHAGDIIVHHWASDLEWACEVLRRFQVAQAGLEGESEDAWSYCLRLKMDVRDVASFVLGSEVPNRPSVDDVLGALIGCMWHYGVISVERRPFSVSPAYNRIMDLVAKAGYAEKSGDAYQWTNKVGPAMRSISAWSSDPEAPDETSDERDEREAEAAFWTMPAEIEAALMERPNNFIYLVMIINRHWKDGQWYPMSEHTGGTVLRGGLGMPRRFMEKFSDFRRA